MGSVPSLVSAINFSRCSYLRIGSSKMRVELSRGITIFILPVPRYT